MVLECYSMVRLLTDQYETLGVPAGSIGVILEVYGDEAYEVEFTREDGTTIDWFSVRQDEVESYSKPDATAP